MAARLSGAVRSIRASFPKTAGLSKRLSSFEVSSRLLHFVRPVSRPSFLVPSQILQTVDTSRTYADVVPLTKQFITDRVFLVLGLFDKIDSSKVTVESRFVEDLGLDSLDHVEIVMAVEDEFGFEIPDSDSELLSSVEKVIQYIMDRQDVYD